MGIVIIEDTVPEPNEFFLVVIEGLGVSTTVVILDDDGGCHGIATVKVNWPL